MTGKSRKELPPRMSKTMRWSDSLVGLLNEKREKAETEKKFQWNKFQTWNFNFPNMTLEWRKDDVRRGRWVWKVVPRLPVWFSWLLPALGHVLKNTAANVQFLCSSPGLCFLYPVNERLSDVEGFFFFNFCYVLASFTNPYSSYMMQSPTRQQQKEGKTFLYLIRWNVKKSHFSLLEACRKRNNWHVASSR